MKNYFLFGILLILSCPSFSQENNLAPNPGFEYGSKSWVIRTATIDTTEKHSGNASLKLTNKDPKEYRVIVTHVTVNGGETLKFSAWVKGQDIKPDKFGKKGAGIYLHAYDENNKSFGGSNPPTPSGTFDWTKVEGMFEVPTKARKIAISLYLVEGNTGTAWFDDINVFSTHLNQEFEVESSLMKGNDNQERGETWRKFLSFILNKPSESDQKIKTNSATGTYIDSEGFTVKDGERIFPFGIYIGKAEKQEIWKYEDLHLKRIKDAGFNTVLSYLHGDHKEAVNYLGKLDKSGLYSIFSLSYLYDGHEFYSPKNGQRASQRVAELTSLLKNQPALLSWYTGDEIEFSHILAAKENYDVIKKIDKEHPVFQVANKIDMVPKLLAVSDVVGTDPYPIGKKSAVVDLTLVNQRVSATVKVADGLKGVWQVIQIFNKVAFQKEINDDFADPSSAQIQNMLYQSIIQGAKGILFYAYHPLWYGNNAAGKGEFSEAIYQRRWKEVSSVSKSFEKIIPIILVNDVVDIPVLKVDMGVIFKAWKYNGDTYMMVANTNPESSQLVISQDTLINLDGHGVSFMKL